jgi:hypothetical protein
MSHLEDLTISEVHCFECRKPIAAIPSWLADAKVNFQCEECRQKNPRIPGMAELDRRGSAPTDDLGDHAVEADDVDEDEEDEADED